MSENQPVQPLQPINDDPFGKSRFKNPKADHALISKATPDQFPASAKLLGAYITIFILVNLSVHAMEIPTYRMDSLTFLSDVVAYCQEQSSQVKEDRSTAIKCKVLETFKGPFKPGSEITINYNCLFGRSPNAGGMPPQKYTDLPLGKALVFMSRNQNGNYEVLDAKLVQKTGIYRYVQFSNPGGLGLVKQAPENITISKSSDYDSEALLADMALALKKSLSLKQATPIDLDERNYENGFGYADPVDDAMAGIKLSKLTGPSDFLFSTSKGRELKAIESDYLNEEQFFERMTIALAIPGDEREDFNNHAQQMANNAADMLKRAEYKRQDIVMWLERNCLPGRTLYLYRHRNTANPKDRKQASSEAKSVSIAAAIASGDINNDTIRYGYCVAENGRCVNSLVLWENWCDPREAVYDGKTVSIKITGGDGQTGAPGKVLPIPLAVTVTDEKERPITNAPIRFEMQFYVGSKNGSLSETGNFTTDTGDFTYQKTDANGKAEAFFKLPFRANFKAKITAFGGGASTVFTETTGSDDKPAAQPTDVNSQELDDGSITVDWKDNSDNATGFIIQRSGNGGKTWISVGVTDAYTYQFVIPTGNFKPENGMRTTIRVIATNPNNSADDNESGDR